MECPVLVSDVQRDSAPCIFQVGSIITTTGYATTDFDLWPALSKTLLVTLMFIGACAGSTSGGIKSFPYPDLTENDP